MTRATTPAPAPSAAPPSAGSPSGTVWDTILDHLAPLFLAGAAGDPASARQTARRMLASYQPETEDELRLAAEIISFGFHALEALGQAAADDIPLTRILRLRGSAVSLSRESHKAQRKLDRVQKDRRAGRTIQPAEVPSQSPEPARPPRIDAALGVIAATHPAMTATAACEEQIWTQSRQQNWNAGRIADSLKKSQTAYAALLSPRFDALQAVSLAG